MPSNTRTIKEKDLLPPLDPTQLERTIQKEKRGTSINTRTLLINTILRRAAINTFSEVSIDTNPQIINMVAPLILTRDEQGDLRDPGGHLCNATCQKIDDKGAEIPDPEAYALQAALEAENDAANADAARPITLADYNHPDPFYANIYAIRPPTFRTQDFELKPSYFTLLGQTPFHGLSHKPLMDHLE